MQNWIKLNIIRPYISNELPGWGRLKDFAVHGSGSNEAWRSSGVRLIRDKRYRLYRILFLNEWADRTFFFLNRWYDLAAQLVADRFIDTGYHVIDVGANYGHFAMTAAARVGPYGKVTAFEPNPIAYERLSIHLRMNRFAQVKAHNAGVSDLDGSLSLKVPEINSGEGTFGEIRYDDYVEVMCPVVTLDGLPDERVDFIKVDVEGFETRVITGGRSLIMRDSPLILTEVIRGQLEAAGSSPEALAEILDDLGYVPYLIGLKGFAMMQKLRLSMARDALVDGDYLWLPRQREADLLKRLNH